MLADALAVVEPEVDTEELGLCVVDSVAVGVGVDVTPGVPVEERLFVGDVVSADVEVRVGVALGDVVILPLGVADELAVNVVVRLCVSLDDGLGVPVGVVLSEAVAL